jgi:cellulose biosynthesis protein BcsQ
MCQFLVMMGSVLGELQKAGVNLQYDWMRYLITRFEPGDGPQVQMVEFMRSLFGAYVLEHPDAQKCRDFGCRDDEAGALRSGAPAIYPGDV